MIHHQGGLASRATAMMNSRTLPHAVAGEKVVAKRGSMSAMMSPKMVVGDTAPKNMMKRKGINIGGGGGNGQAAGNANQAGTGASNSTAGQAALEGVGDEDGGGGLTIGGLTLGGPDGGITYNPQAQTAVPATAPAPAQENGGGLTSGGITLGGPDGGIQVNSGNRQGAQQGQPQATPEQPAAPAVGQPAATPAEKGQPAAAAGEAQKEGENNALKDSEQFSENAGITVTPGGTTNVGGNLGITKGSDGSQSVGGKNGINIAAAPEAGPEVPALPATPPPAPAPPAHPVAPEGHTGTETAAED
ncbi:uncharacterized protein BCR38DRAFT_63401 [Pseudomassariella vexata]|uniref:Uncharacterized protein n=1 Tax=Pseudomassariella vexata TaxID=1141098 RepID=A0A1Y2DIR2_9PEZI|nr:uncharacterized protein BCR38DRAFT_63401 [Pseudomassariella vexata]ORY59056.1 hypothetical protein BCR38DRAFT_63401 [Pseudomassariella vexata]